MPGTAYNINEISGKTTEKGNRRFFYYTSMAQLCVEEITTKHEKRTRHYHEAKNRYRKPIDTQADLQKC